VGDRCYLSMTVRASDRDKIIEAGIDWPPDYDLLDEEDEDDGDPSSGKQLAASPVEEASQVSQDYVLSLTIEEANYGLDDERRELAAMGVPFFGEHSDGGSYGGMHFAAYGGEIIEAPAGHDGELFVVCDWETGEPNAEALAETKKFLALQRHVEALFKPLPRQENK
jgi:hypothetical protein